MAADAILAADGDYRRDKLEAYAARLDNQYGGGSSDVSTPSVSSGVMRFLGARLLSSSLFTRHVLLDRWFLHADLKTLDCS